MISTVETTTSALTTSPEETTMTSTVETTTPALSTSPEETTMTSTVETTTSALTTSPEETTMTSTVETTTSALTTSPEETTMTSTVETTTPALTTSPEETTMTSTVETTTSALTTSPEETTMASTVETTTSALTTSPEETTTASTVETTTPALTTFPEETTMASTVETTTSDLTTFPEETTMASTVETTTSGNSTSTDITTTYKLSTETTKQLTTSSPLNIIMTTRVATAYCPEEMYNNIRWPKIEAGQKDTQQCPPGYTGNVFRICNDNGKWEAPVYIECVNMALYETSEKVNELRNTTNPEVVAEGISDVLNTINNHTTGNENQVTSGDLKHTTTILSDIIDIGISANATVDSEKFGDVLNSVLDTNNSDSWNEINSEEQSDKGASKIMGIVDDLGSLVQKNLLHNETVIINKTNLVIEVSTMKKNLTFPPDSNSMSKLILAAQPTLQDTFYTAALYRTLSGILPTTPNRSVGSDVISVSFGQAIDNLTENITIRFEQNKKVQYTDPKISCGYWNFSSRSWASSGCYLKRTESKVSTCTCNHLTNFAILMSPSDFEITDLHQRALEIITFVGCGLSILGCTLTLITYFVFWRYVKNEWTVILSNMCVVLIIGYSVFLSSTNVTDNEIACIIVTAVLHYVFLVVFFLMLCEGISVARSVTVVFKRKSEVRFYLPFAWGVPLVIVGITLGVTRLKGYHSEKYCWLSTNNFVVMAFVGPALLIILINIGIIHVVLKAIYSTHAMVNERLKKKVRAGVKCMVVLIPVLGLSWLFGILAYNEDTIIFQYLFGISTSLQGFIIFIRDAVSNKKLHEGIRKALHRYRSKSMLKASSKTQSSGLQNRFDFKGNQMRCGLLFECKIYIKNSFNERKRIVAYTKQIVKLVHV
ncbi:unnamed protein product [Mytilus edulis]|uniref:Uncharacterized protein n=1 Tax=Mytilus edulis TaxID=6550 RepID=A0A8S3RXC1_MYTED|nr:unnamed protein product [Mytilus edulis]